MSESRFATEKGLCNIALFSFDVFESFNPVSAAELRSAGWTGPVAVVDGVVHPLVHDLGEADEGPALSDPDADPV